MSLVQAAFSWIVGLTRWITIGGPVLQSQIILKSSPPQSLPVDMPLKAEDDPNAVSAPWWFRPLLMDPSVNEVSALFIDHDSGSFHAILSLTLFYYSHPQHKPWNEIDLPAKLFIYHGRSSLTIKHVTLRGISISISTCSPPEYIRLSSCLIEIGKSIFAQVTRQLLRVVQGCKNSLDNCSSILDANY